jgi:hypothetical protein
LKFEIWEVFFIYFYHSFCCKFIFLLSSVVFYFRRAAIFCFFLLIFFWSKISLLKIQNCFIYIWIWYTLKSTLILIFISSMISLGNRPDIPPRLTTGNKIVQKVLADLEKIKKTAKRGNVSKLHYRCEELGNYLLYYYYIKLYKCPYIYIICIFSLLYCKCRKKNAEWSFVRNYDCLDGFIFIKSYQIYNFT